MWGLIIILILVIIVLASTIKVVKQANAYVIERLGTYQGTWSVGVHFLMPIVDKVARRVSLKEQVADFPPQPVITKDNVTMRIDTVLFFQIVDPKLYCYGVENPLAAIENLTATTLRNIIGDLELDQTLTSRETINTQMRATLDKVTDPWGIKVTRVELKNIIPPAAIQEAMEKQMKAERERREQIIRAEGEKKSAILVSEGRKEAKILSAEADKQSAILDAEAKKQAAILAAEADREAAVQRALGRAEAIVKVQEANAAGIKALNEANPSQAVLAIKGYEALAQVANGKATKLIVPSNIADITSLASAVTETVAATKNPAASKDEEVTATPLANVTAKENAAADVVDPVTSAADAYYNKAEENNFTYTNL